MAKSLFAVAVAVALALVACASPATADLTGTWMLTAISETPVISERSPTLTFAEGRLRGGSGCNRYSGTYEQEGDRVTTMNQQMTIAGCLNPPVMEQEDRYLRALYGESQVSFSDNGMTLTRDDGATLVFVRESK